MLTLDTNNILSTAATVETGKEFVRNFHDYPITAFDHSVLIVNKK
jgi:hypothetical protein